MNTGLSLIKVNFCEEHIKTLFDLLTNRRHKISHTQNPSYDEHREFVKNHPYIVWLLVALDGEYIGSIYLKDDNSVGVNFDEKYFEFVPNTLIKFFENWRPLPPIKSVRNGKFHINIAKDNEKLIGLIEQFGALHIQNTYLFQ